MTDKQVTDRQLKDFRRFLDLLPHGQDLSLVILKGHLLIEEQMWQIIRAEVRKPDALEDGQIECHQAICIAEALCPSQDVWKSVKNRIRNNIAHKVESVGLNDRIDDFVNSVPWPDSAIWDKQVRFEFALWALFEAVSSLVKDSATDESTSCPL